MMHSSFRLLAPLTSFAVLMMMAPLAHAADENTCFARVASEMVSVHDEWRARLFGSRRTTDGKIVALTAGEVDEVRTGIFETKGRLTSEFIEPIIDSYRVYRCRTLSVCQIATQSFETNGGIFDVKLLGCAKQTVQRYGECYFAGETEATGSTGKFQDAAINVASSCEKLVNETLDSERAVLRLAVAYDTGYRSLLQLSGMVDWMLEGFPTATVKAISDMVNMLGKLHQIPCFIGQCDAPNTADLQL